MHDKIFRRSLLILGATGFLLILVSRYTRLDLIVADWMFDFSKEVFPWRHNWFAEVFMHEAMKIALIAFGLAIVLLLTADQCKIPAFLAPDMRYTLRVVVAALMLVPLTISALKSMSIHACPWDLARYGGQAPYLRLFDALPDFARPGHCFPAGHASSGLWLAAFSVYWLPHQPRRAAIAFGIGLIPGALLGWVQQMRGAHFVSHTLWSLWLTGLIVVVAARLLYAPDGKTDTATFSSRRNNT